MSWFAQPYLFAPKAQWRIMQLTDCHLFATPQGRYFDMNTWQHLYAALQHCQRLFDDGALDAIVFTGDLSQDHTEQSYQTFIDVVSAVALSCPLFWLPGNHDDIDLLAQYLNQPPCLVAKDLRLGPWQLLLASSKSGTPAGWMSAVQQQQMNTAIADANADHVAVFCHHHPKAIAGYLDLHIMENGSDWLQQLVALPTLRFIGHGHVHHDYQLSDGRLSIFACPATSIQFRKHTADWQVENLGPGGRLFTLAADGSYQQQVVWFSV